MAKDKIARIVFSYGGGRYHFMSVMVGRDNSFYFHVARRDGEPYCTAKIATTPGVRTPIRFDDFRVSSFDFNKVSLHASGEIHLTDKQGAASENRSFGLPFERIDAYREALIAAPCKPDLLPVPRMRPGFELMLPLPDDMTPFFLSFTIVRHGADYADSLPPPGDVMGDYALLPQMGSAFGLLVTARTVGQEKTGTVVTWPPNSFWLFRKDNAI
ncbi:MAG: hypothetical protein AAB426_11520 [Myxococcota bacterium]